MHWSEVTAFSGGKMTTQPAGYRRQGPASKQWPVTLCGRPPKILPHTKFGSLKLKLKFKLKDKAGNKFQIPYLHQKFAHIIVQVLNRSKHNSNREWNCDDRTLDLFVDPDGE